MAKKTIRDLAIAGKKVLIRVDFNVPIAADGSVADDRRVRGALPTIQYALQQGASVILMSHLGDPAKGARYSLAVVSKHLSKLLPGVNVFQSAEVTGPESSQIAKGLQPGQILVLENVRFDAGETKNNEDLGKQLRQLADVYVNDAFGTCHRKHASMHAAPAQFPVGARGVGFLVEKELSILDQLLGAPAKPMVSVMGGAKVSDKILFIEQILKRVDRLLVGGAMTYTFMKAMGQPVGSSRVEADKLDLAKRLMDLAGDRLLLPVDHLVAEKPEASAKTQIVETIPDGWCAVDIGPKTIAAYQTEIAKAKTVLWNGPMGKFEDAPFQAGTKAIAASLAAADAVTVVGGGESAEAVEKFGFADQLTHVSTGGGAFLEYIEGKPFEPLTQIDDA